MEIERFINYHLTNSEKFKKKKNNNNDNNNSNNNNKKLI